MGGTDAVVRDSRWVWLAASTRRGPHVTPVACSWSNGRLWLVAARASVKVRAIRQTPEVMVLVPGEGGVVASGHATLLDARDPTGLLAAAPDAVRSAVAAPAYAARHARLLAGLVGQAVNGLTRGSLPQLRAVLAVQLEEPRPMAGSGDAALALDAGRGLELVSARWDPEAAIATVDDDVTEGDATFALSFVHGRGDPPLQGTQHRGRAIVRGNEVHLKIERSSWWKGLESGTVQVAPEV